ncbi:MAG: hypothetical protein H6684_01625 [Deltaproteobacteria bacterium]|nr:hypothetical protein [Deltaproteobacteria bacterium]MCB9487412.1 hypothetical protein [Deltaproteobacteria bacterium]
MASNSKKKKAIRKHRDRRMGMDRKRRLARLGTTPKFPIHPEGAPVEPQPAQTPALAAEEAGQDS